MPPSGSSPASTVPVHAPDQVAPPGAALLLTGRGAIANTCSDGVAFWPVLQVPFSCADPV
ncbi:MAG TPA: hypothetical protein VGN81_37515 [Pseudonocardiaceae bacterium]